MILLDTNVVSEVMKTSPAEPVVTWLNVQETTLLHISSVTIGEIAYGLRILPQGRRRSLLTQKFDQLVTRAFEQRVLTYDESAARVFGELMGERKELGRPMSLPDGQIAAIARVHHFALATRNVVDFEHCGVDVINPFEFRGHAGA